MGAKPPDKPRRLKKIPNGQLGRKYFSVNLRREKITYLRKVSFLVLSAFVSPRPDGMLVCHGASGRLDDSLSNLYWGTPSRNNKEDKVRDGTDNRGERHSMAKLNERQVSVIRKSYSYRGRAGLTMRQLGEIFGVNLHTIGYIINNKTWIGVGCGIR